MREQKGQIYHASSECEIESLSGHPVHLTGRAIRPVRRGAGRVISANHHLQRDVAAGEQPQFRFVRTLWNGSSWGIAGSPSLSGGTLSGVTAISTKNAWAVGDVLSSSGTDTTLIEHYNGSSWSVVGSPNPSGQNAELFGVSAYGSKNVWAVGEQYNSGGVTTTLIEHYNGSSWSIVSSPNNSGALYTVLRSVVASSSSTASAVGMSGDNAGTVRTVIAQWNGSAWSLASSPNATSQSYLYGVASASATNVRAVGSAYNGSTSQILTEHYNGTSWKIGSTPAPSNSGLESIARVPGVKAFWAVGFTLNGTNDQTLTDYYC